MSRGIIYPDTSGKALHRIGHLCRDPCNVKKPVLEDRSVGGEMSVREEHRREEDWLKQRPRGQIEHLGLELEAGGFGFYSKHGKRQH